MSMSDRNFQEELRSIQEKRTQDALIDALFLGDDVKKGSSLDTIHLSGQACLPIVTNQTALFSDSQRHCLVLTRDMIETSGTGRALSLLLPLSSRAQLKLVSFAAAKRPLSQSVLLGLNALLVNRDGALFDNLPWSEWSVDPQERNRDAAGNPIDKKFHLGKRDAYNRFIGKDWQDNADDQRVLAGRMVQLQLRELQMDLADIESKLAIAQNNGWQADYQILEKQQLNLLREVEKAQENLASIVQGTERTSSGLISSIVDRVVDWTTDNGKNVAPYRGAMGYAPALDSKQDIEDSLLPYTSPYDLLEEILADQLNAKVIGCVLENTSLLRGNLALGGAVVLQRITPIKTMKIAGEKVEYKDYDEDFGNQGIKAGETLVVECDGDEAIGVALACNVPLKVESNILEIATTMMEDEFGQEQRSANIIEFLPMWHPVDPEMNLQVEGEARVSTKSNPISIPRSTGSLFDELLERKPADSALFPTDNPIKSLDEYDQLSNEDKAKTLLEMSNFSGKLPRPRAVRTSRTNPLDNLLLPLIDESVRRQYYIRDAESRGDIETAERFRSEKSKRQVAKEKAIEAGDIGNDDALEFWESEAEFLESLRADVTQDEGSYSRFLDRDYWYEKERQATARRVDRSKFGNLLDGIE